MRAHAALAVAAIVVAIATPARADARDRTLVLVAPPAVLLDAVRTSLAPWQIRIVVIDAAAAPPSQIASAHRAGFVAIGSGGELHLYDRQSAATQTRPMSADLGEADAAALALTIKTWMRLEPLAAPAPAPASAAVEPGRVEMARPIAPPPRTWQIGASAALGVRGNQGGLGELHARVVLAAGVAMRPVEVAIGVELGPSIAVMDGDQPAAWREQVWFARASRRFALRRALSLRPIAGLALVRATIDGQQRASGQSFAMSTSNLGLDGAVALDWRSGRVVTQVVVGLTAVPVAQRLHDRSVKFDLPSHVEPWATIGAEARF